MNSNLPRVVITDFINDNLEIERDILNGIATVEAFDAHDEKELCGRIEDASAIMLYHNLGLSSATIQRLVKCRLIVRCGVGFDNVDYRLARSLGIDVANVPDYGTEEVADSAIGMALTMTRGIHYLNSYLQRNKTPWMYTLVQPLHRLREKTFGIIGLGRIGTATALRAKALGMNVLFYDPIKQDGYDKSLGVTRVETVEELASRSYILSVHCPLTPESHHIVDAALIARMPHGSYLVNTARGAVVDITAIPPAIESGQLAGAAIDVLVDEPPTDSNPLVTAWRDPAHPAFERVIINPHSAFYCEQGLEDMRRKGAEACRRALRGESLRNIVNRDCE